MIPRRSSLILFGLHTVGSRGSAIQILKNVLNFKELREFHTMWSLRNHSRALKMYFSSHIYKHDLALYYFFFKILLFSTLCVVPSGCDMAARQGNVCKRVDHFILEARLWRYFVDFAAQDRNILSLMLKNLIWICMSGKWNGGVGRLCVLKRRNKIDPGTILKQKKRFRSKG